MQMIFWFLLLTNFKKEFNKFKSVLLPPTMSSLANVSMTDLKKTMENLIIVKVSIWNTKIGF